MNLLLFAANEAAPPAALGKALLVYGPYAAGWFSTDCISLFGSSVRFNDDGPVQLSATEGATFSNLGWRSSGGGSGTNTLRFRKNAADGNQAAVRTGAGFAEDAVNSDVLVAGNLFNAKYTDTGTDSAPIIFAKCNVAFASGHGNFHAAASPAPSVNLNFSATRYFPLSGQLEQPEITIANAQWKNRGYTSVEAIQVYIVGNARNNNTTFRLNVNGTAVGTTLTVGASATGLFTATGLGISIASGDLVCIQWSSGAGGEDFNVTVVAATFKSTSGESETWTHRLLASGYTRTASATPTYFGIGGRFEPESTEANNRIKVGFACRARNIRTFIQTNSCTGAQTLTLFVNGTGVLTRTIAAGATSWQENEADTYDLNDTDEACWEVVGGTSGSCLFRSAGITFSPISQITPFPPFRPRVQYLQ